MIGNGDKTRPRVQPLASCVLLLVQKANAKLVKRDIDDVLQQGIVRQESFIEGKKQKRV